jgi:hypothetical protein
VCTLQKQIRDRLARLGLARPWWKLEYLGRVEGVRESNRWVIHSLRDRPSGSDGSDGTDNRIRTNSDGLGWDRSQVGNAT